MNRCVFLKKPNSLADEAEKIARFNNGQAEKRINSKIGKNRKKKEEILSRKEIHGDLRKSRFKKI